MTDAELQAIRDEHMRQITELRAELHHMQRVAAQARQALDLIVALLTEATEATP